MDKTVKTRDFFLFGIAFVYLFAFSSIYVQIPGLFGKNGVMPVSSLLKIIKTENKVKNAEILFLHTPTLLWFMPLDPDIGMEVLSILGITLSFFCTISKRMRAWPSFLSLWFLYLSIYKVGETFLWFQWDILLLEVGFISILVAHVVGKPSAQSSSDSDIRQVPFYLVKWLLFRLMFVSGAVKLTSQCPTWWGLTALKYHYESQCIPTPLAWWAHQLPDVIGQLSVIVTYVIEILLPFFFFSPLRLPRLFAFYGQLLLMTVIYLTGNYNFFNILTAVLCLSLIDDDHLSYMKNRLTFGYAKFTPTTAGAAAENRPLKFVKIFFNLLCFLSFFYIVYQLFEYESGKFKINFSLSQFQDYLTRGMQYIVALGVVGFVATVCQVLYSTILATGTDATAASRVFAFLKFLLIFGPSAYLLSISMVRFSDVEPSFKPHIWPIVNKWHQGSMRFELVHSYGLFRRMTGVGGRPEVIIEGSDNRQTGWKEYHFLYKPGALNGSLPWAAPHQPRLDWQMWFAALSGYQHNPWIISLMHRLLLGQPEVLDLLDRSANPFPEKPPTYIRAQLYHYHYTEYGEKDLSTDVWDRDYKNIFVPLITKDDKSVLEFLEYNKLLPVVPKNSSKPPGQVETFAKSVRSSVLVLPPPLFIWSIALTAFVISTLTSILFGRSEK